MFLERLYEDMAGILAKPCNQDLGTRGITYEIADYFASDNPNFRKGEFMQACGQTGPYVQRMVDLRI